MINRSSLAKIGKKKPLTQPGTFHPRQRVHAFSVPCNVNSFLLTVMMGAEGWGGGGVFSGKCWTSSDEMNVRHVSDRATRLRAVRHLGFPVGLYRAHRALLTIATLCVEVVYLF